MSRSRTSTIGPYRLEDRLGAGGMGEVWRAWDERLDRSVAVKLIRPESSEDQTARERFRREARAAASLTHPAVVRVYDIVESGEGDAIVMELVEGELLSQRISRGPMPLAETVRLGRQIAEGLAAAHRRGILHRDLKAENVIVTPEGEAKIMDFGLAKRLGGEAEASLTLSHAVVGTFRAMSPEQARGLTLDHRSDLFSFGVLLYEMLTGQSPFKVESAPDTLIRICTARQVPVQDLRPEVPEGLSSLIDHLLEKDPAFRPRGAGELVQRLAAADPTTSVTALSATLPFIPDEPAASRRSNGKRERARRWSVASLGKWAWLTGALLVMLAVCLWFLIGRGRLQPAPTYVAVLGPKVEPAEGDVRIMAEGLRVALVQGLLELEGVSPLAPDQVDAVPGPPAAVARAMAVGEVVTSALRCDPEICRVTLARVAGQDSSVRWTQSFEVPASEPFLLATAASRHIQTGFGEFRRRAGAANKVRPQDFLEYLRLKQQAEGMRLLPEHLLARLEAVRAGSPGLTEASLLEASALSYRFHAHRDPADLEQAFAVLREARRLAPDDPRPLSHWFEISYRSGKTAEAEAALREMEEISPGDPSVLVQRALLAERRGAIREALEWMREGARLRPAWIHLFELASLEYRIGEGDAARRHVNELLRRVPDSYPGLSLAAQIELKYGDPRRAIEIYHRLVQRRESPTELTNLGTAHLLLRQYVRSEQSFRRALALAPQSPYALLSLADALLLQDRPAEAGDLYRKILKQLDRDPDAGSAPLLSLRAQALAHLGENRQAVEAVQSAQRLVPDSAQILYEASLVYVLVGDRTSALVNVHKAIAQGIHPRWFEFSWFDPLRTDPEFRKMLQNKG